MAFGRKPKGLIQMVMAEMRDKGPMGKSKNEDRGANNMALDDASEACVRAIRDNDPGAFRRAMKDFIYLCQDDAPDGEEAENEDEEFDDEY